MTRTIKFRAWDSAVKKMMVYIQQPFINKDGGMELVYGYYSEDQNDRKTLFNNFELMQFTGLLDKNGKEIYEGDIIIENHQEPKIVEYKVEGTVHHDTPWFCGFDLNKELELEIIGNIYENSDLLK